MIRLSQCGVSLTLFFPTEREMLPIAAKKIWGALENTFLATECHLLALYVEKKSLRLRCYYSPHGRRVQVQEHCSYGMCAEQEADRANSIEPTRPVKHDLFISCLSWTTPWGRILVPSMAFVVPGGCFRVACLLHGIAWLCCNADIIVSACHSVSS